MASSYSYCASYLARRWRFSRSSGAAATSFFSSTGTSATTTAAIAAAAAAATAGLFLLHPLSYHAQEESVATKIAPIYNYFGNKSISTTHCDAAAATTTATTTTTVKPATTTTKTTTKTETEIETNVNPKEEYYHNLFPKRQLWRPMKEYPLWDTNWDGLQPPSPPSSSPPLITPKTFTTTQVEDAQNVTRQQQQQQHDQQQRRIRKEGVTRHVILIRHGQYDESSKDDTKRILTPLGREQAALTGKRIAEMIQGVMETTTTTTTTTKTLDDGGDTNDSDQTNKDTRRSAKRKSLDKIATPCYVTFIHSSALTRAKETADIMADEIRLQLDNNTTTTTTTTTTTLSSMQRSEPDPLLNEGRPCPTIPGSKIVSDKVIRQTDTDHERIEEAFRKYFYRHVSGTTNGNILSAGAGGTPSADNTTLNKTSSSSSSSSPQHLHEFEIIVCHANVIRYFLMRALQLPPEAWLRWCNLNCSLTYITIRPTGSVSCRMFGDIGHLPYSKHTFSQHAGYNW